MNNKTTNGQESARGNAPLSPREPSPRRIQAVQPESPNIRKHSLTPANVQLPAAPPKPQPDRAGK